MTYHEAAMRPVTLTLSGTLRGMRRLSAVSVFVIPFGLAFGIAASEAGLTKLQTILMSAIVFSGVAQFATLDFWQDSVAFLSLAFVVMALNGRHVIMGAALSPWVNHLPVWRRALVLAFLTDANFADSEAALRGGERDLGILLGGGVVLWLAWVFGTAMGALGGQAPGPLDILGLDVVMVCFFAAVVAEQLRAPSLILPVAIASVIAYLTAGLLPTGWNILLAAVVGGFVALATDAR